MSIWLCAIRLKSTWRASFSISKTFTYQCWWVVIWANLRVLVVYTVCDQAFIVIPYGGGHKSLWIQDLIVVCSFFASWFFRQSLCSLVLGWYHCRYIWKYEFCTTETLWRSFNNGCFVECLFHPFFLLKASDLLRCKIWCHDGLRTLRIWWWRDICFQFGRKTGSWDTARSCFG